MCGIAGWLGTVPDSEVVAARMVYALRHRGPDGNGTRLWSNAAIVHTRLSIIDLSPAGAQPMANEDGTVWTVFNGEIYNHREIRNDLASRGHIFKGRSDSEILPHLYEEEGSAFVNKLRGMFALAIYDTRTKTLLLARDRFGIKPLFYAPSDTRVAFGSEIKALLTLPGINSRPNTQAIHDFAALCYIPAPNTFFAGIQALEPGQILEARVDADDRVRWKTQLYQKWVIAPDARLTLPHAVVQADSLITAAVRRQLESDVPLGALLSGGIDSSLVSAAAQTALNGSFRTFNVRFRDKGYDETWAAVAVAKHIGSRHETLDMDEGQGTWERVTGLLRHAGQPFADTSLFGVNAVCRMMRQHLTVALSGDGGDEAFGGYDLYRQITMIAGYQKLPVRIWHGGAALLSPLARCGMLAEWWPQQLRDLAGADDTSIIQRLWSWTREEDDRSLCQYTDVLPVRRMFEPQWEYHLPRGASRLERLSAHSAEVTIRLTLPNDFLFKVDTASMKESLEVRVPMLDEDLFAFGLSLPHHLKVTGRTCKRVLRAVAERKLPYSVASKPKQGFGVPVDSWVDADFKERLRDTLLGPSTRISEYFRPEVYRPILETFCSGHPGLALSRQTLYQRVIMLLSLHLALSERPALASTDKVHST